MHHKCWSMNKIEYSREIKNLNQRCSVKTLEYDLNPFWIRQKENDAAAIVSNDSDMLIYAVCPVMVARGLVSINQCTTDTFPNLHAPINRRLTCKQIVYSNVRICGFSS